ncbi:hypothetical protein P9911_025115 [Klebsiella oxytoca]|uniref:hypothetical protein n=1 Tax=Enterobacterales TaxID=91347 RepID=UPI001A27DBDB|nr:hypothetical protein [Klebsiella oxytoca]MEC5509115.1 hypothetical protein [Klebsiella oxytoca]HAT1593671.1 hypothetical protein [Klebsiella oxytoca]
MTNKSLEFNKWRFLLSFVIFLYILIYTFFTLKFLLMACQDSYSFLGSNYSIETFIDEGKVKLALFTIFGAILGGATLGIISLHKYSAVSKDLDIDHLWGYLMAPVLSLIIGILIFCFLQSGLLVLTGDTKNIDVTINIKIGYFSLGAICAYNWDVFIIKLQKLSSRISDN